MRSRSLSVGHTNDRGKNVMIFKSIFQGHNHEKLSGKKEKLRKKNKKPSKIGNESIVHPRQILMHQYFVPSPKNTNKVLVGSETGNIVETSGEEHENLGGLV